MIFSELVKMKINFALLGLAAAQSGDAKDYEYDYPSGWVFKYFFGFQFFDLTSFSTVLRTV